MRRGCRLLFAVVLLALLSLSPAAQALSSDLITFNYPASPDKFEIRLLLSLDDAQLKYFRFRFSTSSHLSVKGFRSDGATVSVSGGLVEITRTVAAKDKFAVAVDCAIDPAASSDQTFSVSGISGRPEAGSGAYIAFPSASITLAVAPPAPCAHPAWQTVGESTATCTEAGQQAYVCQSCGEEKLEPSPALGHQEYWREIRPADCVDPGIEVLLCQRCDVPPLSTRETGLAAHSYADEWSVTLHPTCTTDGVETRECSFKRHSESRPIPQQGHAYGAPVTLTPSTCAKEGEQKETCGACGQERLSAIPLAPHVPGAWVTKPEPTCTEAGYKYQLCEQCENLLAEASLPALEHEMALVSILPDDCEAESRQRLEVCTRCGIEVSEAVPPQPHDVVRETIPPGCERDGSETWHCTRCSAGGSVILPGFPHPFTAYVTSPVPDCVTEGKKTRSCMLCGFKEEILLPPNDWHDYSGPFIITVEPTCSQEGERVNYCLRCKEPHREALSTLPHAYGDWINQPDYHCERGGERVRICTADGCGAEEREWVGPGEGHEWGEWEEMLPPECLAAGEKERICALCQAKETGVIPKLGHDYGAWVITLAPTCYAPGEMKMDCRRCGDSYVQAVAQRRHTEGPGIEDPIISCQEPRTRYFYCQYEDCDFVRTEQIPAGEHRMCEWETTRGPTCTENGESSRKCSLCAHTETRPIRFLWHDLSGAWRTTREPTCKEPGEAAIRCKRCEYEEKQPIAMLRHSYSDWRTERYASCQSEGRRVRRCESCGAEEFSFLPRTAHHCPIRHIVTQAGCLSEGLEEGDCSYCGQRIQFFIPAAGHHYGSWETSKAPACGVPGEEVRSCSGCGQQETRATMQLFHVYAASRVVRPARCEEAGLSSRQCTLCQETFEHEIAPMGHSYGRWERATYTDCAQGGIQIRACQRCQKTESRAVGARKHAFGAWKTVVPATCSQEGTRTRACRHCEATEDQPLSVRKHVYQKWVIKTAPTCSREGTRTRTCKYCGDAEAQALPVRKHVYQKWVTQIAASCTQEGKQTRVCKYCGDEQSRSRPMKRHWAGRWQIGTPAELGKPGEKVKLCGRCGAIVSRKAYTLPKRSFAVSFCALGLPLRELQEQSKSTAWYMLTPVDLTVDGEKTYPLIADNSHAIGEVTVKIEEGEMTVGYELYADSTEVLRPSLRIFLSAKGLTDKDILSHKGQRKLGEPISIARNLKGAKLALISLRLEGLVDKRDPMNAPYSPAMLLPSGERCEELLEEMRELAKEMSPDQAAGK